MVSKQTILTLEKAVEKVLESAEIVILPPEQRDTYATDLEEDNEHICHRSVSLPNDVARTLEVHKRDGGPMMKKLCLNLSQMLDQVQVFVKPHSRKKTQTVYWNKQQI